MRIPQSVAITIVFRAISSSDHFTPATGKTIAMTISKNGGAFGNPNAGALNATELSSGFYKFALDATDTGTNGPLAWRGAGTGVDDAGDVHYVATFVDQTADVSAVKTVTDKFVFTVANQVDANTESINATTVLGNGSSGDLWRG